MSIEDEIVFGMVCEVAPIDGNHLWFYNAIKEWNVFKIKIL